MMLKSRHLGGFLTAFNSLQTTHPLTSLHYCPQLGMPLLGRILDSNIHDLIVTPFLQVRLSLRDIK